MNIPNFLNEKIADENGYLTEPWKHVLEQLLNELQTQMSNESHIVPSQPTSNITQLNVSKYTGGLLYDETTKKLNINLDGTFKEVLTT